MITTVTLNASIDKAYHMNAEIVNGTVMRVVKCSNSAGGKGLNVARIVKLCGADVLATGLVGGFNGQYLESMLKEDGIPFSFGHVEGETRCCINILDPKYSSTEYLEPGFTVSKDAMDAYLEEFREIIKDSDVVTISGSAPAGTDSDVYARMVSIAEAAGKKVILDTSGELLRKGITAKPTVIKPNQDEIEALCGIRAESGEDVIRCAKDLHEQGIPYVLVSLGGEGALMVCGSGVWQAVPPKVDVVNTVGCGDSMVGGFAVGLERNMPDEEVLRYAAAAGTANALFPGTGGFEAGTFSKMLENMEIRRIS